MRSTVLGRLLSVLVALLVIAAACGDNDADTAEPEPADDSAEADEDSNDTAEPAADDGGADDAAEPAADAGGADDAAGDDAAAIDLTGVCPDPFIIQSDWFPESEHGASYQLVGDDYTVDTENLVVTGSLVAGDVDTGIDVEVRAGGPAIGFVPTSSRMYAEPEIHLGFVSTDQQVLLGGDAPTIAVIATLEKSPLAIQWDPETYPEFETIADIGEAGIVVHTFAGSTYIDVLVSEGLLSADQIDPSYDGSPARWIVEDGAIAQQAFASESPYSYEFVFEEWGKPIDFELIHDAAFPYYQSSLAVRADQLETLRPCLEQLIPIIQQAILNFAADPSRANAIIVDAVAQYDSFWVYGSELAQFSVDTQLELGLIGNGSDDTVGNFEPERVDEVIEKIIRAGFDVNTELQFEDITTNEFIDESIGF